jgi:hypothetical protein
MTYNGVVGEVRVFGLGVVLHGQHLHLALVGIQRLYPPQRVTRPHHQPTIAARIE